MHRRHVCQHNEVSCHCDDDKGDDDDDDNDDDDDDDDDVNRSCRRDRPKGLWPKPSSQPKTSANRPLKEP